MHLLKKKKQGNCRTCVLVNKSDRMEGIKSHFYLSINEKCTAAYLQAQRSANNVTIIKVKLIGLPEKLYITNSLIYMQKILDKYFLLSGLLMWMDNLVKKLMLKPGSIPSMNRPRKMDKFILRKLHYSHHWYKLITYFYFSLKEVL